MRRKNDILYDLLDSETGQWETYEKITTLPDGTAANDTNILPLTPIYRKSESEYFRKSGINTRTVSLKEFGAVGDGVADDTESFQKAINYLSSSRNNPQGSQATFGMGCLYIPKGRYKITGTITIDNANGLKVFGDGAYSTSLEYHSDTGIMFDINAYISMEWGRFSIYHMNTSENPEDWSCMAFSITGLGGGQHAGFNRIRTTRFDTVFNIEDVVSGDSFHFNNCRFGRFNTYWKSDNPLSLDHVWDTCMWDSDCEAVFDLGGGAYYQLDNAFFFITGDLFRLRGNSWGAGNNFLVNNAKFEWEGGVPGSSPCFVNVVDDTVIATIQFNGCGIYGGVGALDPNTVNVLKIRGRVSVDMNNVSLRDGGSMIVYRTPTLIQQQRKNVGESQIIWRNCMFPVHPTRVMISSEPGNENMPHVPIKYIDCTNVPNQTITSDKQVGNTHSDKYKTILQPVDGVGDLTNRLCPESLNFNGFLNLPISGRIRIDAIRVFVIEDTDTVNMNIIRFYSDEAKTNLIATQSTLPGSINQAYDVLLPNECYTSEGLFVNINNIGQVAFDGFIEIDYSSVGIQ